MVIKKIEPRAGHLGSFEKSINYANRVSDGDTWMSGVLCAATAAQEMESVWLKRKNKRMAKRLRHMVLCYALDERPTREQVERHIKRALRELDMAGHQFFARAHWDTENFHVHVIVNCVGRDGKAANSSFDYRIHEYVSAMIAIEHSWKIVDGRFNGSLIRDLDGREPVVPQRGVTDGQFMRQQRSGEVPWRDQIRPATKAAVQQANSWWQLAELLPPGVFLRHRTKARKLSGEIVHGLSFSTGPAKADQGCSASSIGDECKYSELVKRFGPWPDDEQEFLKTPPAVPEMPASGAVSIPEEVAPPPLPAPLPAPSVVAAPPPIPTRMKPQSTSPLPAPMAPPQLRAIVRPSEAVRWDAAGQSVAGQEGWPTAHDITSAAHPKVDNPLVPSPSTNPSVARRRIWVKDTPKLSPTPRPPSPPQGSLIQRGAALWDKVRKSLAGRLGWSSPDHQRMMADILSHARRVTEKELNRAITTFNDEKAPAWNRARAAVEAETKYRQLDQDSTMPPIVAGRAVGDLLRQAVRSGTEQQFYKELVQNGWIRRGLREVIADMVQATVGPLSKHPALTTKAQHEWSHMQGPPTAFSALAALKRLATAQAREEPASVIDMLKLRRDDILSHLSERDWRSLEMRLPGEVDRAKLEARRDLATYGKRSEIFTEISRKVTSDKQAESLTALPNQTHENLR